MFLYHGSEFIIKQPKYGLGKRFNDYGRGFYCTEEIDRAKEWSVNDKRNGYVNCYEFSMQGLRELNLNSSDYTILNWLTVLLQNREFNAPSGLAEEAKDYLIKNFNVPYKTYDVIRGYRADDSYFSFSQDFLSGAISYRQLCSAMYLGMLGEQVVIISKKAFSHLKFIDAPLIQASEWYKHRWRRDQAARRGYSDVIKNQRQKGDLFITQILDEEMQNDDPRLRQTLPFQRTNRTSENVRLCSERPEI